jgi:CBS domain-containing protein
MSRTKARGVGIGRRERSVVQLSEVMTRDVEVIRPDATLQQAAERMTALDVGSMPVGAGDRLVGVLSDRDITVRATAAGRDPRTAQVRDAMSADILYCFEDQGIDEATVLMEERQLSSLLVLNRDERLVGIVSLSDLVDQQITLVL